MAAKPIRVTVEETAGGVRVVYELDRPVTRLDVGGSEGTPPSRATRVAEPGIFWRRGRFESERPFRHITLLVGPDDRERDARYALLTPIHGGGFVLFAPYLLPSAGAYRLHVAVGGGALRQVSAREATGGYVLVGAAPREAGPIRALRTDDLPPALEAALHDRITRLLLFYRRAFGRPPGVRPLVVMIGEVASRMPGFRGDVSPNGFILLRFRGTAPDMTDAPTRGRVTGFLAHELIHLWNGRRGAVRPGEAWLHEGTAEYYSWRAVARLWPGEISLERNLQNALDGCMAFLGGTALSRIDEARAQLRYPCGAVAQWLVDLGTLAATGGRRDGFALWAGLLGARRGYSLADFRAAAAAQAPSTAPLLFSLLDTGLDWAVLPQVVSRAGADVTGAPPTPHSLRFAAARPIALALCTDYYGSGEARGSFYFTGECGALGSNVTVVTTDDIDPMTAPQAFQRHVRDVCAAVGPLALRLRTASGDIERVIRCTVPVAPAVPDISVRRALPAGT